MLYGYLVTPSNLSMKKIETTGELAIELGHIGLYGTDSGLYKDPKTALKHLLANIPVKHTQRVVKQYKDYK